MTSQQPHDDLKLYAALAARAAIKGHTLIKVGDGYIVAKGAHSRHCADLGTVLHLLQRMGAWPC
jgi:hypothetical protein